MKQLFLGIAVGIWVSIISIFLLKDVFLTHYNWELVNEYDNIPKQVVTVESPDLKAEFIIPEEHIVAIKYVENHVDELISDANAIKDFRGNTPFEFSIPLYAIKNENAELWEKYWLFLYDTLEEAPFARDEYAQKLSESFQKIITNSLEEDMYIEYLLDGAVYFSNKDISEKEKSCENVFKIEGEKAPNDGVQYCTSLSYVYEAIRKNDISYCSKISYIPEDTALLKNCEALFAN